MTIPTLFWLLLYSSIAVVAAYAYVRRLRNHVDSFRATSLGRAGRLSYLEKWRVMRQLQNDFEAGHLSSEIRTKRPYAMREWLLSVGLPKAHITSHITSMSVVVPLLELPQDPDEQH